MSHKGIVHSDMKPENVLLTNKGEFNIRVADFGFSSSLQKSANKTSDETERPLISGTPGYIAPELFERNGGGISCKTDIFSTGSSTVS